MHNLYVWKMKLLLTFRQFITIFCSRILSKGKLMYVIPCRYRVVPQRQRGRMSWIGVQFVRDVALDVCDCRIFALHLLRIKVATIKFIVDFFFTFFRWNLWSKPMQEYAHSALKTIEQEASSKKRSLWTANWDAVYLKKLVVRKHFCKEKRKKGRLHKKMRVQNENWQAECIAQQMTEDGRGKFKSFLVPIFFFYFLVFFSLQAR